MDIADCSATTQKKLMRDNEIKRLLKDNETYDLSSAQNRELFLKKLAFYSNCNREVMKNVFRFFLLNGLCDKRFEEDKIDRWIEEAIKNQIKNFFVQVDKLETKPPNWLVPNYIEAESLVLLFGEPEVGKTFFSIDLACSIATGKDFHGLSVDKKPVFYIKGEGHNGFKRRIEGWKKEYNISEIPLLFTSETGVALNEPHEVTKISDSIEVILENQFIEENPALIVVDTLARNFDGDENSNKDMSAFVKAIDKLRSDFQCTVLILHHPGHSQKNRERGAYALRGAIDTNYRFDKTEDNVRKLQPIKMKEAKLPEPLSFEFKVVDLDDQHEGIENTSLVLKNIENKLPIKTEKNKNGKKGRGKAQRIILEEFDRLYKEKQKQLKQEEIESNVARIDEDELKKACLNMGIKKQTWGYNKQALVANGDMKLDEGGFYLSI